MASPDITPYVDLTLYDADAQSLTDAALAWIAAKFPDFSPRESDTAVVVIEALALEVEAAVFAINRVPGAVLQALLRLYGVEPDPGTPATATVTVTAADTTGHTVPTGTRFLLDPNDGTDPVILATVADLTIAPGTSSGAVAVVADGDPRVDLNGTPAGTPVEVLDAVAFIDTATLASALAGGSDPEEDTDYLTRAAARLQRLVTTLVRPDHFTAAAAEQTYVARAFTVDTYDPTQNPPTGRSGHVTVVVAGPDGAPLAATDKTALELTLEEQALAVLDVHIADATTTTVNITATVRRDLGADPADVDAAVRDALTGYLNPATWPFASTVYRNDLIGLLSKVDGVARVVSVDAPAADVALPGVGPLAKLGAVNLTVIA